jgi:mannose/cellobiose epimerase-like protein (N-acyl-D-glucosamine 2-epimerase family)
VVEAVEQNRFVMDERQALRPEAAAKGDEYGPRMILLGAASLLREIGFDEAAAFGMRFIEHVLRHHVENGSGTVRDIPGGDHCNPGHAIEFTGFSLEYLPADADRHLVERLEQVLLKSFDLGFSPPGILLRVSVSGADPPSLYRPWWSLPETVRAASLAYCRTQNPATWQVWRKAHDAFFAHYWRSDPPIAYQTLTDDGPVDYVPATPDLDPSYHTGLSFLSAIRAIDSVISASVR